MVNHVLGRDTFMLTSHWPKQITCSEARRTGKSVNNINDYCKNNRSKFYFQMTTSLPLPYLMLKNFFSTDLKYLLYCSLNSIIYLGLFTGFLFCSIDQSVHAPYSFNGMFYNELNAIS